MSNSNQSTQHELNSEKSITDAAASASGISRSSSRSSQRESNSEQNPKMRLVQEILLLLVLCIVGCCGFVHILLWYCIVVVFCLVFSRVIAGKGAGFNALPSCSCFSSLLSTTWLISIRIDMDKILHCRSITVSHEAHRMLRFEPSLKRESPGRIQPLSEFGRVASDQSTDVSFMGPCTTNEKANAPSWCVATSDRRWPIDQSMLRPHPGDYPTERTSRVILGADVNMISSRLTNCLQSRSIETKFSECEPHVATCRNTSFVKFYIRLYMKDDGVLVELHRLCGDCMSFMRDCRALLDASEGGETKTPAVDEQSLFLNMPISEMSFFKTATVPPVDEAEAVNMTAGLLASNMSDSNLLGMESLATLTDVDKTDKATAILSAKRVLCPEHIDNKCFSMHTYVMSLIVYNDECEDNSFFEGTAMEDHKMKLRNLAICSVANALSLMVAEKTLFECLHSSCQWYKDVLVPQLVQDLSTSKENPHDACYASRCLHSLASSCNRCIDKIKVVGGLSALKSAQEVGQSEFALLEKDAKCCHDIVQMRTVC